MTIDPITLISHRATLKKVSSTPGTTNSPPQVAVTLVFPMTHETTAALGALLSYVSHDVDTSLLARHFPAKPNPNDLPLDQLLAQKQREAGQEERTRPGPEEHCIDCAKVIGEDPDAGFHVPLLGAPSPLCGPCAIRRREEEPEEPTDPQSYCPLGDHWLALPIGETCEIHHGPTYLDPAEAEAAASEGGVPAVLEAGVPEIEGAISWCPNCKDAYPFPAGGECWICKAGTVSEEPAGIEAPPVAAVAAYVAPGEEPLAPEDGQVEGVEPIAPSRRRR